MPIPAKLKNVWADGPTAVTCEQCDRGQNGRIIMNRSFCHENTLDAMDARADRPGRKPRVGGPLLVLWISLIFTGWRHADFMLSLIFLGLPRSMVSFSDRTGKAWTLADAALFSHDSDPTSSSRRAAAGSRVVHAAGWL